MESSSWSPNDFSEPLFLRRLGALRQPVDEAVLLLSGHDLLELELEVPRRLVRVEVPPAAGVAVVALGCMKGIDWVSESC